MHISLKPLLLSALFTLGLQAPAHADDEALRAAIASPARTPAFVARDVYRHPYETLSFFGIRPYMTVVELSPGGGWYTEILAPYLRDAGQLVLAADDPDSSKPETVKGIERFKAKLAAQPALYDKTQVTVFAAPTKLQYAAPGSADIVLTFRNVHNWMVDGDEGVRAVFASAYKALKPGGVLGIEEHRLPASREQDATSSTGYMHQAYVVRMAESAGFKLDASAEINANPKDTADHVGGVWALPPSYANKDVDRASYQAIGESDRMTLRFVKPVNPGSDAKRLSDSTLAEKNSFANNNVSPRYPPTSLSRKEQGRVVLRALVDAAGTAKKVELKQSSGYSALDKAAIDAVATWRFIPAQINGTSIEAWVDVPVNFSVKDPVK